MARQQLLAADQLQAVIGLGEPRPLAAELVAAADRLIDHAVTL
jgi:hypothetical protein